MKGSCRRLRPACPGSNGLHEDRDQRPCCQHMPVAADARRRKAFRRETCMHHRTKRQRDTPMSKGATKTLRGALGWCLAQRSRSRWARRLKAPIRQGTVGGSVWPGRQVRIRDIVRRKRRQREMHRPQRDQKGDNGGTNKVVSVPATPDFLWCPAGRTEPRMDASRSGPSGGSLIDGISGPGGCGRGDFPGGRGAGCLGIGSLQRRFCSAYLGIQTHVRISSHRSGVPSAASRELSGSRCAGRRMGPEKGPAKARGPNIYSRGSTRQRAHYLRPARTLFGCIKATSPPKSRQDQPQSCLTASPFVLKPPVWTKADELGLSIVRGFGMGSA